MANQENIITIPELYTPTKDVYDEARVKSDGRITVKILRDTLNNAYFDDKLDMGVVVNHFPYVAELPDVYDVQEIVDVSTLVDAETESNETLVFSTAVGYFPVEGE